MATLDEEPTVELSRGSCFAINESCRPVACQYICCRRARITQSEGTLFYSKLAFSFKNNRAAAVGLCVRVAHRCEHTAAAGIQEVAGGALSVGLVVRGPGSICPGVVEVRGENRRKWVARRPCDGSPRMNDLTGVFGVLCRAHWMERAIDMCGACVHGWDGL